MAAHRDDGPLTYSGRMVARHETHPSNAAGTGPAEFRAAVESMRTASLRPEVFCEEMPAPQRIAPWSSALSADVTVDDEDLGTGRLILLHDPAGNDAWDGTFRCVAYVRADIDPELGSDPMLAAVGWSWLTEALEAHAATFHAASGTVTCVSTESFGGMADEDGHRPGRDPRLVDARRGRGRHPRHGPARRGVGRAAVHRRRPAARARGRHRHPEPARTARPLTDARHP